MHDWAASLGIAAITPELISPTASEFEQNLAGVLAVLNNWQEVLTLPADRVENGFTVPALIWRYWQSHGGEEIFGLPLAPAEETPDSIAQTFSKARLEWRPRYDDTVFQVQPAPLGWQAFYGENSPFGRQTQPAQYLAPTVYDISQPLFFAETDTTLGGAFLNYWRINGGVDVFGLPISDEFEMVTADGQQRIVQYFERAQFAYYPEDGSVRPEPLGWAEVLQAGVDTPHLVYQIR
jgi:hypothetical protein